MEMTSKHPPQETKQNNAIRNVTEALWYMKNEEET